MGITGKVTKATGLLAAAATVGVVTMGASASTPLTGASQQQAVKPFLYNGKPCERTCEIKFRVPVGANGELVGFETRESGPTGMATGHASYLVNGEVRGSKVVPNQFGDGTEALTKGACGGDDCVIGYGQGAHAGGVTTAHLDPSTGISFGAKESADTPDVLLTDLDRDKTPDVTMRFSTYEPDFATGPQFWGTFRNDNGALNLTGCSTPTTDRHDPLPAALLTASCPMPGQAT
jgi:hypothetical protein